MPCCLLRILHWCRCAPLASSCAAKSLRILVVVCVAHAPGAGDSGDDAGVSAVHDASFAGAGLRHLSCLCSSTHSPEPLWMPLCERVLVRLLSTSSTEATSAEAGRAARARDERAATPARPRWQASPTVTSAAVHSGWLSQSNTFFNRLQHHPACARCADERQRIDLDAASLCDCYGRVR